MDWQGLCVFCFFQNRCDRWVSRDRIRAMRQLLLIFLFTHSVTSAESVPRLSQISLPPSIPDQRPLIQDLDGDTLPELIYLGNETGNPCKGMVIRNLGSRAFSAPTISLYQETLGAVTDSPVSLVELGASSGTQLFFNQLSCLPAPPQATPVSVSLNSPGGFGLRVPLSAATSTPWIAVDLEADHCSEFVQALPSSGGRTELRVWERQANGEYRFQSTFWPGSIQFNQASAQDADGDGDLDLWLTRNSGASVLLERIGPRAFSPNLRQVTLDDANSEFVDLNGDGLPEAYTTLYGTLSWRVNSGGLVWGNFQTHDFLGNDIDRVTLLKVEPQKNSPAILTVTWVDGSMLHVARIRFGSWDVISDSSIQLDTSAQMRKETRGLSMADFDGDTFPDLLIHVEKLPQTFWDRFVTRPAIAWGSASGFGPPVFITPTPISSQDTLVGTFDGDVDTDLILGPDWDDYYWFYPNSGKGAFPNPVRLESITVPTEAPEGTHIVGLRARDLNGDSIMDLEVSLLRQQPEGDDYTSGTAIGRGDGTFLPTVMSGGDAADRRLLPSGTDELFDWDGDGDLDAVGNGFWIENQGGLFSRVAQQLVEPILQSDPFGNFYAILATRFSDLDGDGFPDIIAAPFRVIQPPLGSAPNVKPIYVTALLFNDGHGGIASVTETELRTAQLDAFGNPNVAPWVLADLNADGRMDLVFEEFAADGFSPNTRQWLENPVVGARNLANWTRNPLESDTLPLAPMHDFDGDGQLEWVTPKGYLRPTSAGPVASPVYHLSGGVDFSQSERTYSADFDGDGDVDFLIRDAVYNLALVRNPSVDERSAITHFLVAENVQPNRAGPDNDADGDGRDNATELLFGTNPTLKDSAPPANPLDVQLGSALTFRLPHLAATLRLDYQVETSNNLSDWSRMDPAQASHIRSDEGWDYFSRPVGHTAPSAYFRIRASHLLDE
jgi:hypothetical protein